MKGLRLGPPGRQGQLTHRLLGLSSGGSSGGGDSAAPGAPGGEMLASAAASRPIPGSGGGGCGRRPASQAARPRPRPGPDPRPLPPPPPRPAGPARPPGCTPELRLGPGERTALGRAPREARGGAEARPERGAQRCPLPPGSGGSGPRPAPTAPPPLRRQPGSARCAGLGASGTEVLGRRRSAPPACAIKCMCECVRAPACDRACAGPRPGASCAVVCVRCKAGRGRECARLACAWVCVCVDVCVCFAVCLGLCNLQCVPKTAYVHGYAHLRVPGP